MADGCGMWITERAGFIRAFRLNNTGQPKIVHPDIMGRDSTGLLEARGPALVLHYPLCPPDFVAHLFFLLNRLFQQSLLEEVDISTSGSNCFIKRTGRVLQQAEHENVRGNLAGPQRHGADNG